MNGHRLTRREFLSVAGSGVAVVVVAGCSSGRTASVAAPAGEAFSQASELVSVAGRLDVTLTVEARSVPHGSGTRFAYTYNGSTPGPTLRVRTGDQLVITLQNRLGTETNLHTHGLHVSPSGDADNIFVTVAPGGDHTYTYLIPADHPSGLFWYHPHAHGHVAEQIAAGLAGAIIVSDSLDEIPEIAASTERLWVLTDPPIGTNASILAVSQNVRMQGRQGNVVLVNGVHQPDVAVTAGMLQRWRFVNASAARYYHLALDGHQLNVIASDGGRLPAPVTVPELLLAPGERTELLITPTSAGTYRLRSLPYNRGTPGTGGGMGGGSTGTAEMLIATMTVTGTAAPAVLPSTFTQRTPKAASAVASSRTLTMAMGAGGGGMGGGGMGGGGMMGFTIDGKTFDPQRTDIAVKAESTEEWAIRNTSAMDHPFHLHVWPFQIVDGPPTSGWKDTVNVPANATVRIRIPFTDIVGRTVYHCHILDHEDLGMMGVIDVTT